MFFLLFVILFSPHHLPFGAPETPSPRNYFHIISPMPPPRSTFPPNASLFQTQTSPSAFPKQSPPYPSYFPQQDSPLSTPSFPSVRGERVAMPPANASDLSEVPLEAFAEGEMLESDMYHGDRWDTGSNHSHYSSSSSRFRQARARCSSSTLFDDARPVSEMGWSHGTDSHPKHVSSDHSPIMQYKLQQPPKHHQYYRGTFDPSAKKQSIQLHEASSPDSETHIHHHHHKNQHQQHHREQAFKKDLQTTGDTVSMNSYGGDSPSWSVGARLKIEPSTPRPPSSSSSNNLANATKVSSPLTPTTPLTPVPADLDKPAKNLMIFNKIPRQWPASQETLHYNYVAKPIKKVNVSV